MNCRSVLLLNMNYYPLKVLAWQKAAGLVLGRKKAQVIEDYAFVHNSIFNAAVVKLIVKSPDPFVTFERHKFSKRMVFLRDKFTCQYCDKKLFGKELTIDHVYPRARGGKTTFLNCTTACRTCNWRKGNKTLEEIGMTLLRPTKHPNALDYFNLPDIPTEWRIYLSVRD